MAVATRFPVAAAPGERIADLERNDMGENSKIAWCHRTFNPWMGCSKIAPECASCYAAEMMDHRYGKVAWGPNGTRVRTSDANWKKPLKWNRDAECLKTFDCANGDHADCCPQKIRPRVFCASLADVFEKAPLVEWREFSEGYRVSIYGQVQSRWRTGGFLSEEWRDMRPRQGRGGYLYFDVKGSEQRGTVKVHKVVMEAFVGLPTNENPCVRHLDGNPANNHLWNLLYGTQKENQEDMRRHGTSRDGTRNGRSKLLPAQVEEIKQACLNGESQEKVAVRYGIGQTAVSRIVRGLAWYSRDPLPPYDGKRHCTFGHIIDHRGRPLFHDQTGYSHEPGGVPTDAWVPATMDDLRRDLFALIDATPNLDWLLLTKRPENVRKMWPEFNGRFLEQHYRKGFRPNVWLGTSAGTQATYDRAAEELRKCRDLAPVLFISGEPLLENVDLRGSNDQFISWRCGHEGVAFVGDMHPETPGSPDDPDSPGWKTCCSKCGCQDVSRPFDLIITGCESGNDRRPMKQEWPERIARVCAAAGVAYFNKQMEVNGKVTDDLDLFPEPLRIRQFPTPTLTH